MKSANKNLKIINYKIRRNQSRKFVERSRSNLNSNNIPKKLFDIFLFLLSWQGYFKTSRILIMPTSLHLLKKAKTIHPFRDDVSLNEKDQDEERNVDGLVRRQRLKVCQKLSLSHQLCVATVIKSKFIRHQLS